MDTYVILDPTRDPEDMVVSVHGREQGAVLAALDYAVERAPIEFPMAKDRAAVVQKINERLAIVNKDLQDPDE